MLMENNQRVTETHKMGINLRFNPHFPCSVDSLFLTKSSHKDTKAVFPSSLVMGRELSMESECLAGNFGGTTYFFKTACSSKQQALTLWSRTLIPACWILGTEDKIVPFQPARRG